MKNLKLVTVTTIFALGIFAIPVFAAQWNLGTDLRTGFGQLVVNLANNAIVGIAAIPDGASILLLGTGLLALGTFVRVHLNKVPR